MERTGRMEKVDKLLYGSVAGLVAGILLTVKAQRNAASIARSSGGWLAIRALGLSTILSISSLGIATAGLAKCMQVTSFKEFGAEASKYLNGLVPESVEKELNQSHPSK